MKISLLLPYWDRQEAADKALALLAKHYADLDLEVIIVDDGNVVPFVVRPDTCEVHGAEHCESCNHHSLNLKIIRLPRKDEPKSPCVCWNEAAKAATGDILVLSCIEILHDKPILEQLAAAVDRPNIYAIAAAWCPEHEVWHTHSSVKVPDFEKGVGIGFCAALHKDLYWKAGGFDEDYRDGAGYEDRDWIKRLLSVGTKFVMRDDLVVIHPKTGASIAWGGEKFDRNFALYRSKWNTEDAITFICLNAGNYCGRGAEYVNILSDMVRRNMPQDTAWRFVCLTDNPEGLNPEIKVMHLPDDLKGWWGKLYLFKRGLFPDGSRMIFLDLDTLILGSIEKIIGYTGDMAILRDFYQPQRGAPGVILWRSGFGYEIWDEWESCGRPENPLGDLGWIEGLNQGRFTKQLDRLQDLYPGSFVSYKVHCKPYPPDGAVVVCFHGLPRPHDVSKTWVGTIWKMGGGKTPELVREINTAQNTLRDNIETSSALEIPWLDIQPEHNGVAVIVGGGPSLESTIGEIKALWKSGATIIALNNAARYLLAEGIPVAHQIMLDARKTTAEFISPADHYFIGSTCNKGVFDAVGSVTLFHPHLNAIERYVPSNDKPLHLIGGGSTVGLIAMSLVYTQGYRDIHLFGYDSSYKDGNHHAYPQTLNDGENVVDVICEGKTFKCAAWMVTQTQEFQDTATNLAQLGCEITVHGSGLLPHVAWNMALQNRVIKEVA